ncbi:hypothetical protein UA08_07743 [Talaromyces atroroseus]|uniref:Serine hydrolase domain-containing protein n=1 Tax=Talaromyces atroroseus TaxID=1441469 RepID=A0A225A9Z0_TALAT|nr:hypothetical protein UA08_07743 [Talaromyces atroroseus]OKL56910.1 hypothetical protein UA08_07743 [Talaromyces atroroseus]
MVRILCLHGHGTSSQIFETQLATLCKSLPEHYEYVYADGEIECDRAPGKSRYYNAYVPDIDSRKIAIPQTIPGPFLCYFNGCSCGELQEAHDLLDAIIDEEGPFDGVFAFSQGAALTMSYLLELERQNPRSDPPFKFAVLFSPTVALCPDPGYCSEEMESLNKLDYDYLTSVLKQAVEEQDAAVTVSHQNKHSDYLTPDLWQHQKPDFELRKRILVSSIGGIIRAGLKTSFLSASSLQGYIALHDNRVIPRVFHPALMSERIRIPVVQATGLKDDKDLQAQFKIMPLLCKESMTRRVLHNGGHDLPRAPGDIREIVKAIEWVIAEGDMPTF